MAVGATAMTAQHQTREGRRGVRSGGGSGAVVIVIAVGLLVVGLAFFVVYARSEKAQTLETWNARLSAMADDRNAAIGMWVAGGTADAFTVASFPTVVTVLSEGASRPQSAPGAAAVRHVREVVDGFRRAHGHRAAFILDAQGALVASSGSIAGGDEVCTALAERLAGAGTPFAEFCARDAGTPSVLFGAPVTGSQFGAGGRPARLGMAVVAGDPTAWLYPLLTREPTPTASGEVLLAEREGDEVVFLSPLRHVRARPLGLRVPLDASPLAVRAALEGVEGFGEYVDYRGVPIFAATHRIAGTSWVLVAKIDQNEALSVYRNKITSGALALGGFLLAVVGTGFGLWRARRAKYEAEIARGQARLALLLDQANDAILFIAPGGQILDANRKAEALYGYDRTELLLRNVRDLRAEDTRGNVVEQMARAAEPAGYMFRTVHRRKDGATFPVEVSSRLAEFDRGKAFLSIVRDLSEREAARRRIEALNRLLRAITAINQLIVRERDQGRLLSQTCQIAVEHGEFRMAWVGLADFQTGEVRPAAVAGFDDGYLDQVQIRCDDSPMGRGPTGTAIREGRVVVANDWDADATLAPWREAAGRRGYRSSAAFPITVNGLTKGALSVYAEAPGVFVPEIVDLLEEVSQDLGFALQVMEGEQRRRRAEEELERERNQAQRYLDVAGVMLVVLDIEGRIELINGKGCEILGYREDELLRRNWFDLCLPEGILEETRGLFRKLIAGDVAPIEYHENAVLTARAEERVLAFHNTVLRDASGRITGVLFSGEDITERKRAQAAIQVSETRYRRLFESAKDGILILDADSGKITAANPFLTEILGYSKDELLGHKLWDIGPFKDITATKAGFAELLEKGYVRYENLPLQASNGRIIDVEFVSNTYLVNGKKVIQCNIRDISDRTRVEKALRESEERYRRLVDSMQDVVFTVSTTGELMSLNPAFERITGWACEEWIGKPFKGLVHPDDLPLAFDLFGKFLQGQASGLFEVRIKARDGSWLDGEFSGVQLVEKGRVTGVLGTARDVTQRKRESEERRRLAAAVQQSAEAIVVTDLQGTLEYVNPAFERITGYTASEVIGQNPRILKSGRHDADFYREMWETLKGGEVWSGRLVNRRRDGTLFEEDATISPVRDPLGRIEHFVAVKRDVTQEAAIEERLRQAQRIEAVGRLAGGVAHDFNNLLQAMLTQTQLIRARSGDPERVNGTVDELEQHIRRGAALSRQLLLFSRRETAKPERLDLTEAVGGATQLLRRLVRENIIFTVELADEPLPVVADRGQLDQVLMNLVVNAADAMSEGGHMVVRCGASEGDRVWVSVEDTGHGIPAEIRDRIFEPFFTTKGEEKGSGLGLSVVHGIVTQHCGTIVVADREGGGSIFRIELPRDTSGEVAASVRPRTRAQEVPRGKGEHIIVVEDEEGAREGLFDLLTMLGYQVTAVGSAREVEGLPARPAFDVLLSDLLLPDVSGADLARRLLDRWPRLKVILMSGYTEDEAVRRGVGAGTVRFLQKPFDMRTLAREIRTALVEG